MNRPPAPDPVDAWQIGTARRVADHLRHLSERVAEVEEDVCINFDLHDRPGDPLIQSLQHLDYLRQSLEDVAILLDAFNTTGKAQARHLGDIKMDATRALVHDERQRADIMPKSGSIDLF